MARTAHPGSEDLGLVDALAQLTFSVQGALGRIAAAHDLSIVQTRLLGLLRDRQPTITELAAFLQLDKSSVTGLVDRAQERGLVRRSASVLDGRSVQVGITSAGRQLADLVAAAFEEEVAVLVSGIPPAQQARLSATASQVVIADAERRGIDILDVQPTTPRNEGEPFQLSVLVRPNPFRGRLIRLEALRSSWGPVPAVAP